MNFYDEDINQTNHEVTESLPEPIQRKPFAYWKVGEQVFKAKLTTAGVLELEKRYKTNLINLIGSSEEGMPALTTMLDVMHVAMAKWNHGIKKDDMHILFDRYLEEGGNQIAFITDIYMEIFAVSGFFSATLADRMEGTLEDVREKM